MNWHSPVTASAILLCIQCNILLYTAPTHHFLFKFYVEIHSNVAPFAAILDEEGGLVAFERLPILYNMINRFEDDLEFHKVLMPGDMSKLRDLVVRHKPHVVVISAENTIALKMQKQMQDLVYDLTKAGNPYRLTIGLQAIDVHLVDPALSIVYGVSKRGQVGRR